MPLPPALFHTGGITDHCTSSKEEGEEFRHWQCGSIRGPIWNAD